MVRQIHRISRLSVLLEYSARWGGGRGLLQQVGNLLQLKQMGVFLQGWGSLLGGPCVFLQGASTLLPDSLQDHEGALGLRHAAPSGWSAVPLLSLRPRYLWVPV